MNEPTSESWRTTHLTKTSKWLRLAGASLFLGFVLVMVFVTASDLLRSNIGFVVLVTLLAASLYDFHFIFRRGLRWNDHEIQQTGTLFPSPVLAWKDLSAIAPKMQKRKTVLSFKKFRNVDLYWGYENHREILDFAKGKLNDARAS